MTMPEQSTVAPPRRVRSATERAECLALFAESGLSAAAFCREMQLSETTFALWRRQARTAAEPPMPRFAPVQIVADPPLALSAEASPAAVGKTSSDLSLQLTVRWPSGVEAWVHGLDPVTLLHVVRGVR